MQPISEAKNSQTDCPELMKQIRSRIEQEDSLNCQRLSFLVNSQSFLLSGYAILLNGPTPSMNATLFSERQHHVLFWLLPVSAILTISIFYLSILGGLFAMADLRRLASDHGDHQATLKIQGSRFTLALGLASPVFLPLLFLATWIILLMTF